MNPIPAATKRRLTVLMTALVLGVCLAGPALAAEDRNDADSGWLGGMLGLPKSTSLPISPQEMQSLGCILGGAGIAAAVILFSGAAIAVTGGPGAAATTTVAVPVLAAAAMAGCLTGSAAAPGVAWLARNKEKLFGKIVDAIPVDPLTGLLPGPNH